MMRSFLFAMNRTVRFLTALCFFALIAVSAPALLSASQDNPVGSLLLCSECGREPPTGALFCPSCGASLPLAGADGTNSSIATDDKSNFSPDNATSASYAGIETSSGAKAAVRDASEARKRQNTGDLAAAVLLYHNAQALLMANAGPAPSAASLRTLASETATAEETFNNAVRVSRRAAALAAASHSLESYYRGEGRTPLGRVWVPADWPSLLAPPAIVAIKLALPTRCDSCQGSGSTPCRSCGAQGSVPCKFQGCKNGWVTRKPTNTLSPKTDLNIREKCPACRGSARVPCRDCAGRGSIPCKQCGGSGDAPVCKACGGLGLTSCKACAKSGIRPDCPVCRGTGMALCGKCNGDGHQQR